MKTETSTRIWRFGTAVIVTLSVVLVGAAVVRGQDQRRASVRVGADSRERGAGGAGGEGSTLRAGQHCGGSSPVVGHAAPCTRAAQRTG